ncbi:hypothetical protein BML2496_21460 [Providencia rettgeri]|nr:hypothetical protein BML2496_21460 [Providencia rettgeri]
MLGMGINNYMNSPNVKWAREYYQYKLNNLGINCYEIRKRILKNAYANKKKPTQR